MGLPVLVVPEFSCDDTLLGREITLLSAQINVANYRLLKLIAEFDIRGAWCRDGAVRSCAHWLAAQCGMTIGAAREKVRVARRLDVLPEVDTAFSTGELSYSKVRAITRVATEQNEGFMVMMAETASASHLEKLVSKYQPVEEAELAELGMPEAIDGHTSGEETDEDELRERSRELYWFQDKDGMWVIHAKLPPEQGQLVMKALEAFARPLQEERQDDWKAAQQAQLQAAAREISRRHRESGVVNANGISAGCAGLKSDTSNLPGVASAATSSGKNLRGNFFAVYESCAGRCFCGHGGAFFSHLGGISAVPGAKGRGALPGGAACGRKYAS